MSTSAGGVGAASVDHVWANARVFFPGGTVEAACQLGGDSLGPHLDELAGLAIVIGPTVRSGDGWRAVEALADRAPFAPRSFDLVVVEDLGATGRPPKSVLAEAQRLCRPTGRVVIGSRSRRVAFALRRGLRGHSTSTMTALPSPRRPAFILDPHDRDVTRYFMRRMAFAYREPGRAGLKGRSRQLLSRAVLAAPPELAVRAAPGKLAIVRSGSAPDPLLSQIIALVRWRWTSMGLAGVAPERLEPLVVGHRRPNTGVVTILLFPPGGHDPVVAKLPRYGSHNDSLQREAAGLERVSRAVGDTIGAAIPRSLGIHTIDGTDVLLQTGLGGRHLVAETASGRLSPAGLARQLDVVLSWWDALQAASGHSELVDNGLIATKLEPLAEAGLAALGGDRRVAALLDRTLEQARSLNGTSLPMVVVHGDYWAGNVLVERERVVGVVDWERSTIDDLPFWDPVKAVGSAAYHLDRYRSIPKRGAAALPQWGDMGAWNDVADPRFAVGFRAAFVQPGWLADTARHALVRAFDRAGIPRGWLPVATTLYLVRQIVQADDSPRSVAGWGSVLLALAMHPGTWTDEFSPEQRTTTGAREGQTS
ncbi:MAG: aminoglycoside phosphotransferase family protein [Actinomycetota bacterium]|nr:aminoglycoside phosphotransferase family protein [Actinomycetota bacterium]